MNDQARASAPHASPTRRSARLVAVAAAPSAQAETARQGLVATFINRDGGRMTAHGAPPGASPLTAAPARAAPLAGFQLLVRDVDAARARNALAGRFAGQSVDWCVSGEDDRVKRLLICDMDSTVIGVECVDELADALGIGKKVAAITEKAMRGDLNFEASLRARVKLLKGAPLSLLEDVWAQRVAPRITPGARTLVATMKALGAYTALVSGGFTFFAARVAAELGFDSADANVLEDNRGKLTGKVREPVLGPNAKLEALTRYAYAHGEGPEQAIAIGDGANDLAMMEAAGLGVAFRAKPKVAERADAQIHTGDLRSALLFQGIGPDRWVGEG